MSCIGPLQSSGGMTMSNFDFTHLSIYATYVPVSYLPFGKCVTIMRPQHTDWYFLCWFICSLWFLAFLECLPRLLNAHGNNGWNSFGNSNFHFLLRPIFRKENNQAVHCISWNKSQRGFCWSITVWCIYSLVRLVMPNTEELISQPLQGL